MARRVFFSFHYDNDIWRANQVRNANVVHGADTAGFFDHSEYLNAKAKGSKAIERMILGHLNSTSVTVVLIGTGTAHRPWVKFEIAESVKRKNGLLGIRIHHLKNHRQESAFFAGPTPFVPWGYAFPVYDWDRDIDRLRREIESAGKRSDAGRASRYQ